MDSRIKLVGRMTVSFLMLGVFAQRREKDHSRVAVANHIAKLIRFAPMLGKKPHVDCRFGRCLSPIIGASGLSGCCVSTGGNASSEWRGNTKTKRGGCQGQLSHLYVWGWPKSRSIRQNCQWVLGGFCLTPQKDAMGPAARTSLARGRNDMGYVDGSLISLLTYIDQCVQTM